MNSESTNQFSVQTPNQQNFNPLNGMPVQGSQQFNNTFMMGNPVQFQQNYQMAQLLQQQQLNIREPSQESMLSMSPMPGQFLNAQPTTNRPMPAQQMTQQIMQPNMAGMGQNHVPAGDWRHNLNPADRWHVASQLSRAISLVVPRTHQNQSRVINLARSLEQHIFGESTSRHDYLRKIGDHMKAIQEKATNQRMSTDGAPSLQTGMLADMGLDLSGDSPNQNQMLGNNGMMNMQTPSTQSPNMVQGQIQIPQGQQGQSGMVQNNGVPPNNTDTNSHLRRQSANNGQIQQNGMQMQMTGTPNTSSPAVVPTPPPVASSPSMNQPGNVDGQNIESTVNVEPGQNNSATVHGMLVTLLNLSQSEKETVMAMLDQIRPTYLRIDSLINSLLENGGEGEFEKVRKLSGMKQMIGAQLDVVDQDIYFIRPETLQQLVPSLQQYFRYSELLANGARAREVQDMQANIIGNRPPNQHRMNGQMQAGGMMLGNPGYPGQSPHMSPAAMAASPIMRPPNNLSMNQQQARIGSPQPIQASPSQQIQQHQFNINNLRQQMTNFHARLGQINQHITQLQSMQNGGQVSPESMANFHMQTQDLMKQQQQTRLALHQCQQQLRYSTELLNQAQMQRPNQRNMSQMQMMQDFNVRQGKPNSFNQQAGMMNMSPNMNGQMMNPSFNMGQSQASPPAMSNVGQGSPIMHNDNIALNMQPGGSQLLENPNEKLSNQGSPIIHQQVTNQLNNRDFGDLDNSRTVSNPMSPLVGDVGVQSSAPVGQTTMNPNTGLASQFAFPQNNAPGGAVQLPNQKKDNNNQAPDMQKVLSAASSKSKGQSLDNWEDEFNFNGGDVEESKEDDGLGDFFNFDYQPPSSKTAADFDSFVLDSQQIGDDDLSHFGKESSKKKVSKENKESPTVKVEEEAQPKEELLTGIKRSRDEELESNSKKVKTETKSNQTHTIENELEKIKDEYSIKYSIKNTPSKTSSSAIVVSFEFEAVNFQLSIRNKTLYERGRSKGLVSFSTNETPDKLTELVSDLVTPTSNPRITEIVQKLINGLKM